MAIKKSFFWNHPLLHLGLRLLGLAGLFTVILGLFAWHILDRSLLGKVVVAIGAVFAGLALAFEVRQVVQGLWSSRGAFGSNVFVQIALAIAIVVFVNVASFTHFRRFDWTRDHIFTVPEKLRIQLSKLRGTTDIIVLQQYVSFGQGGDNKQDKYDLAAQRKIVEKVKDLAAMFQDLGPRFRVQVLDIQDDDYLDKLRAIRAESPDLANAIEKAPENSIFFYARDRKLLQRLSFSDLYQLDKVASMTTTDAKLVTVVGASTVGLLGSPLGEGPLLAAFALYPERTEGRGNLVLKYQGAEGFAHKILNIEEKKPRIATAIIHPYLGLQNKEIPIYNMSGAKKLFDDYGFDSMDVMVRKIDRGRLSKEGTVLSYEESRYKQIRETLDLIETTLPRMQKARAQAEKMYSVWSKSSLAELNKEYGYFITPFGESVKPLSEKQKYISSKVPFKMIDVDDFDVRDKTAYYKREISRIEAGMDANRRTQEQLLAEKRTLNADRLDEKERLGDIEAKMNDILANTDLLIVPRLTLRNAPQKDLLPNRLHRLDEAHLKAIKTHLSRGKPALFLLGPTNEPIDPPDPTKPPPVEEDDPLELALFEMGFKLPKQTILYDNEADQYQEQNVGVPLSDRSVEVPGLLFDDTTRTRLLWKYNFPLYYPRTRFTYEGAVGVLGSMAMPGVSGLYVPPIWLHPQTVAVEQKYKDPLYLERTQVAPEAAASSVGYLCMPSIMASFQVPPIWLHPDSRVARANYSMVPHPIRTSLKTAYRTASNKESYQVRVRHPRPVYYFRTRIEAEGAASLVGSLALVNLNGPWQTPPDWQLHAMQLPDENAVFLLTSADCWNEDNPFISDNGEIPRYLPDNEENPKWRTLEEMRRGSFPIGVAVETQVPASWYESGDTKPKKARVAVIGSGSLLVGGTLSPMQQKILLDTTNWLLGRDDLLARGDATTWQYPRLEMSAEQQTLWEWGARLGLPLAFVFLGMVVWLVRNMR